MAISLRKLTSSIGTRASTWALLVVAPACALLLLAVPRQVGPFGMPELALDGRESEQAIAADAELAAWLPVDEDVVALEQLLRELGEAQREIIEGLPEFSSRREALRVGVLQLSEQLGPRAPAAMRARAVARMEAAIAGNLPEEEIPGVMGSFANILERHGALAEGRLLAPRLVLRVLYKARWNLAHSLPNDHALLPIEERALHGWMGLHGARLPVDQRMEALKRYHEAGGPHVLEAQAVVMYGAGQHEIAAQLLERVHDARPGQLRLRNFILGARLAAGLD